MQSKRFTVAGRLTIAAFALALGACSRPGSTDAAVLPAGGDSKAESVVQEVSSAVPEARESPEPGAGMMPSEQSVVIGDHLKPAAAALADSVYGFEKTDGVAKEALRELASWLEPQAERGDPEAQFSLGYMYEWGSGVEVSGKTANAWYSKAARQGHADAQYRLARELSYDDEPPANRKRSLTLFRQAAESGHKMAQFRLGRAYLQGESTNVDYAKAATWFLKAALQGSKEGFHYYFSAAVSRRPEFQAMSTEQILEKLIDSYSAVGADEQYLIAGLVDALGSESKAEELYKIAAENGSAPAAARLGMKYDGRSSFQTGDLKQAAHWYRMAAEAGNSIAQEGLCYLYYTRMTGSTPSGATKDDGVWCLKSAEHGDYLANRWLGQMYLRGVGFDANKTEAIASFRKAALRGDGPSFVMMKALGGV